jgi:hypothetical protein
MKNLLLGLPGLLVAGGTALAHEGHGLPGSAHWHASDATGFVLVGVIAAALLWLARRK